MQHWPIYRTTTTSPELNCSFDHGAHHSWARHSVSATVTLATSSLYAGASSSNCVTSCTQSSTRDVSSVSDEHCWVGQCRPDTFRSSINVVDGLHTATTEHKVPWTCILMERTVWRSARRARSSEVQKTVEGALFYFIVQFAMNLRLQCF